MRHLLFVLLLSVSLLSACARGSGRSPGGDLDGGLRRDAADDLGPVTDMARVDLGAMDLGETDLGTEDLGATDLGASDLGATDLGAPDLGGPDLGGPDLGASDLGTDLGPPGCSSAASCQDGLACNGVEACIGGACRPGTPIVCDDGIACTTNTCLEPSGTCDFARNDSACPAGQTCTAPTASGCASSGTCSESPCRLVSPQCGCPTAQACTLSGATRVCAAAGTGATGSVCGAGTLGCSAGNLCLRLSATATTAACARFCATDADCSGPGALCLLTLNDSTGAMIPGVTVCSLACDPTSATSCPSGSACRIFRETATGGRYLTNCEGPVGAGTQGSPCINDDQCAGGFACLDTGFGNECTRWCNVATGTGCPFGTICQNVFAPSVTLGTTTYGVCL